MPSFRRQMSLRPVKSEKHEITWSNLGENASTPKTVTLIQASGAPTTAIHVEVGSTIRSIFVEFNLNGVDNSGTVQVFHWAIMKAPSGDPTFDVDPTTYNGPRKRFTLKRGMEMLPEIPLGSGGTVQTKRVFVVKIPPRMRRFGDDDQLQLMYKSTSTSGINFCGIAIFKEFK